MTRLVPGKCRRIPGVAWVCRRAERRHRHWQALRRLGRRPPPYRARWGARITVVILVLAGVSSGVSRVVQPLTEDPVWNAVLVATIAPLLGAYLGILVLAAIEHDFAPHGRGISCRSE